LKPKETHENFGLVVSTGFTGIPHNSAKTITGMKASKGSRKMRRKKQNGCVHKNWQGEVEKRGLKRNRGVKITDT